MPMINEPSRRERRSLKKRGNFLRSSAPPSPPELILSRRCISSCVVVAPMNEIVGSPWALSLQDPVVSGDRRTMLCDVETDPSRLEFVVQAALKSLERKLRPETSDEDEENPSEVIEFRSGESSGPFPIKSIQIPVDGHPTVSLIDLIGNIHRFEYQESDQLLNRLSLCPSPLLANCVVVLLEGFLQLLFTRDIPKNAPLMGVLIVQNVKKPPPVIIEKRYTCPKCNVAKFNSLKNLQVHQQVYCTLREARTTQVTSPVSNVFSGELTDHPHVILLPVAYHDFPQQQLVQPIGPAQTLVPVAIGRPSIPQDPTTAVTPLLLRTSLGDPLPTELKIAHRDFCVKVPVVQVDERPLPQDPATTTTPLDLSSSRKREALEASSPTSSPPPLTKKSGIEKPFTCTCGVSFTADATLKAHQQFYCKNSQRPTCASKEASRKVPTRCSQCDFEPQSVSQLSVHVRSAHHNVKAYICNICGYRGFSMRGIRTHLRSHSQLEGLKFDTLLEKHVSKITSDEK
ncbi:unnamed protein product [Caenorhabditis auriculariae]|uniref:C2H2-type domain-containing protein n=1 Tax=Caenorhabditis auriculariae TaxID=2777116 RepID=A0A8S1H535_9PELO|nr:unnamed protein product [Caenorhabditis auriculariae]